MNISSIQQPMVNKFAAAKPQQFSAQTKPVQFGASQDEQKQGAMIAGGAAAAAALVFLTPITLGMAGLAGIVGAGVLGWKKIKG